ncbi:MAG: GDSL-type esterase/lipase family protein [Bacteroidota bacterium]
MFRLLALILATVIAVGCKTNVDKPSVTYKGIAVDRHESEIEAFRDADSVNPPEAGAIVFTGSSSIRMWSTLEQDMSPLRVVNRGFGGSTIPEVNNYFDDLIFPHDPSLVVFYCGENDLNEDKVNQELALDAFKEFLGLFSSNYPKTELIYLSKKPSVARWDKWAKMKSGNDYFKEYLTHFPNYHYLDISETMLLPSGQPDSTIFIEDMLHMNTEGYARWTTIIKPYIQKLLNKERAG